MGSRTLRSMTIAGNTMIKGANQAYKAYLGNLSDTFWVCSKMCEALRRKLRYKSKAITFIQKNEARKP
ncbi:hypothetical protein BpHYR1_045400 [Brachionus plicatilis]|uniref:Uncharacterized protein n=1 Tax=Brachionus plicatilis TaxID=10195 RepID=A0A3M7SLK3_BRAPC|nr:hypothetical protein BpHYR1_045400 [Brachionus plicatilis]